MDSLNQAAPGTVLLLEQVEQADAATVAWLERVLDRPGWLQLPLLLSFEKEVESEILKHLPVVDLRISDLPERPEALPPLSPPLRNLLRLAGLIGTRVDVELLAEVSGLPESQVLLTLQEAADVGVPLKDLGQGEIELAEGVQRQLLEGLLPSLESHWRRRIAQVLSVQGEEEEKVVVPPVVASPAPVAPAAPPEVARPAPRVFRGRRHPGRAAGHLAAAGMLEGAARQYLVACQRAAARGAAEEALAMGGRAMEVARRVPLASPLRAEIGMELARVQWELAVPGICTLSEAHSTVDHALTEVGATGILRARILTVRAGIRYETGDPASLEGALSDLTEAMRLLQLEGDARAAARLLNEQAAVWIRMGDPVRATWLLRESLKVYEAEEVRDPQAAAEWAETQHLLARLPLHVQAKEGQQAEALARGQEHAAASEGVWKGLGAPRELARVWDTRGNLLLREGKAREAGEFLRRAAQAQRSLGDVVGMAISMGGLAEVEVMEGRPEEALRLLSDSIALNREKGSIVGLYYNQQAVERLRTDPRMAAVLPALLAMLKGLEKELK